MRLISFVADQIEKRVKNFFLTFSSQWNYLRYFTNQHWIVAKTKGDRVVFVSGLTLFHLSSPGRPSRTVTPFSPVQSVSPPSECLAGSLLPVAPHPIRFLLHSLGGCLCWAASGHGPENANIHTSYKRCNSEYYTIFKKCRQFTCVLL